MILWWDLSARGLQCFYPLNLLSCKVHPYFPDYLFLNVDIEQVEINTFHWLPILGRLLTFDGIHSTVPLNMMQAIHQHADEMNAAGVNVKAGLKRGEVVEIRYGAFERYESIFDVRLSGKERVRELLNLLQARQFSVELPAAKIQPPRNSHGK